MGIEENKEVITRIFDEVWNRGHTEILPELLAPEYIYHAPTSGLEIKGAEGYKRLVEVMKGAIPDRHAVIESLIGEGNSVSGQFSSSGTFTGKLLEWEPTGRRYTSKFAIFYKFKDGQVIEETEYTSGPSFHEQVGIKQ